MESADKLLCMYPHNNIINYPENDPNFHHSHLLVNDSDVFYYLYRVRDNNEVKTMVWSFATR